MTQKTKNAPLLKKYGILELFCGIMEKFHFYFLFEGFPYTGYYCTNIVVKTLHFLAYLHRQNCLLSRSHFIWFDCQQNFENGEQVIHQQNVFRLFYH